jgi:hypothetical protein
MLFYLVDSPLLLGACRLQMSLHVSVAQKLQTFGVTALMHQNGLSEEAVQPVHVRNP